MGIRVVFLDFGGTLSHNWFSDGGNPAAAWVAVAAQQGLHLKVEAVEHALAEANRELAPTIYSYLGRTSEYWRLHDDRVSDSLGIREGRAALFSSLDRWFADGEVGELYPDTVPALEAVGRQGYRMGVISNHTDRLLSILDRHRLREFFESVTFSQEAGVEKPEKGVFALALRRMRCAPEEAVFVGDSWNADVVGARGVGIRPIWLNRSDRPPPGSCDTLRDLSELPGWLALEGAKRPA